MRALGEEAASGSKIVETSSSSRSVVSPEHRDSAWNSRWPASGPSVTSLPASIPGATGAARAVQRRCTSRRAASGERPHRVDQTHCRGGLGGGAAQLEGRAGEWLDEATPSGSTKPLATSVKHSDL